MQGRQADALHPLNLDHVRVVDNELYGPVAQTAQRRFKLLDGPLRQHGR